MAHVHWVYCAYILLKAAPIEVPGPDSLEKRQHRIEQIIASKKTREAIQLLTQIDGPQRYKTALQSALEDAHLT
jgi:hypothetical protein